MWITRFGPRMPWLMLAVFLGIPIVDSGIGVARAYFRISMEFAGIETKVEQLKVEASLRDPSRPVLHGEELPGEAWEDYFKAAEVIRLNGARQEMSTLITGYYYGHRP